MVGTRGARDAGRRRVLAVAATALVVAIVAGAGAAASTGRPAAAKPTRGGAFVSLFTTASPPTWDPTSSNTQVGPGADGSIWASVFGMLVYEDYSNGRVVPWMARSLTATDASHWILKLRDGVRFTDGTAYDALAVQYNWQRYADPATRSPNLAAAQSIASTAVVDPMTLSIELKEPSSYFDRVVAESLAFIGSPTALRSDPVGFRAQPVAAGPFVLKSYQQGVQTVLERNGAYWDQPRPYLDSVTYKNIADDQQRYNTFVSDGASLERTNASAPVIGQARSAGTRILEVANSGGGTQAFLFNTARAPFDDPLARRAIQRALDVEGVNDTVYTGLDGALTNLFERDSEYYDEVAGKLPGFNEKQAQRLIDQYVQKAGKPLSFTLAASVVHSTLLEYLRAQLAQFSNVDVKVQTSVGNAYVPSVAAGNFDLAYYPVVLGDPGAVFDQFLRTGGVTNYGKYSNAELDKLLTQVRTSLDDETRIKAVARIQRIIVEDAPLLFVARIPETLLAARNVRGLKFHVWGQPLLHQAWLASD